MPFKSERQRKWMWQNKPKIAKRWAKKYGVSKSLPEKKRTYVHGSGVLTGNDCLRKIGAL